MPTKTIRQEVLSSLCSDHLAQVRSTTSKSQLSSFIILVQERASRCQGIPSTEGHKNWSVALRGSRLSRSPVRLVTAWVHSTVLKYYTLYWSPYPRIALYFDTERGNFIKRGGCEVTEKVYLCIEINSMIDWYIKVLIHMRMIGYIYMYTCSACYAEPDYVKCSTSIWWYIWDFYLKNTWLFPNHIKVFTENSD